MERRTNAEVLDILYAVALGEGFIAGMYEYKEMLISGAAITFSAPGQGLYRVLISFVIIILSWLHYRSSTLVNPEYPRGEFVMDVIIVIAYMMLFLFVDAPMVYYVTVAMIWLLYVLARALSPISGVGYTLFGLIFIVFFAAIAFSSTRWVGDAAEWTRLVMLTVGVVVYRPLDRWYTTRCMG